MSVKDTAAIIEIDRVMLESGAHWPDLETDALVVRHVKELTRMLNAERAAVQALRDQASRAYQAGTDNFRRFYDAELFAVIGVTGFRDLYAPAGSVPSPEAAAEPSMTVVFDEGVKEPRIISWNHHPAGTYWLYSASPPAAQAVQPARVVRAAIGESKPLTAEQYASIRKTLP